MHSSESLAVKIYRIGSAAGFPLGATFRDGMSGPRGIVTGGREQPGELVLPPRSTDGMVPAASHGGGPGHH